MVIEINNVIPKEKEKWTIEFTLRSDNHCPYFYVTTEFLPYIERTTAKEDIIKAIREEMELIMEIPEISFVWVASNENKIN